MDGKKFIPENISKKREKISEDKNGKKNYDIKNNAINDDKLKETNKTKIRRVSYSDIVNEEIDNQLYSNNALHDKEDKGNQNSNGKKR